MKSATHHVSKARMRDDVDPHGTPWPVGTLRVLHTDDRDCWSVVESYHDYHYGTALHAWRDNGGEVFDGERWLKLTDWWPTVRWGSVRIELWRKS